MALRHILRSTALAAAAALLTTSALAARVLDERSIQIDGQARRDYHLHDAVDHGPATPIVLLSGSGCKDFGSRVPLFFEY